MKISDELPESYELELDGWEGTAVSGKFKPYVTVIFYTSWNQMWLETENDKNI